MKEYYKPNVESFYIKPEKNFLYTSGSVEQQIDIKQNSCVGNGSVPCTRKSRDWDDDF